MRSTRRPPTSWLASVVDAFLEAQASRREQLANGTCPPRGQMLTVAGKAVHVRIAGAGPDLVMLHGASGNLHEFDDLGRRLAHRFRVIALDRPGFGHSDGLDLDDVGLRAQALHLAAACRQLGVTRPLVLGHSYGGSVALAWGLERCLDLAGLVLVSAPSMPWDGRLDSWYQVARTGFGQRHAIPAVAAFVPEFYLVRMVREVFAPEAVPPDYYAEKCISLAIRRHTLLHNTTQINRLLADIGAMIPRYGALDLPVELLHGTADQVVPFPLHSQRLTPLLPDARLTVLPQAGHMVHLTRADAVEAAVLRLAHRSALRPPPQSQY